MTAKNSGEIKNELVIAGTKIAPPLPSTNIHIDENIYSHYPSFTAERLRKTRR